MFKVAYNQTTKIVIALGEFTPLPKECAQSKAIEGNCPVPLFNIGKNHIVTYLYQYDEESNKLVPIGKDLVVIVSS